MMKVRLARAARWHGKSHGSFFPPRQQASDEGKSISGEVGTEAANFA